MDEFGNRMKTYENSYRTKLPKRMPVVIRIDGKAFHTYTRGMQKPFDLDLTEAMWETCKFLCKNIVGCKLAYHQSDEISLLLTNYDKLTTEAWFDNNLQKIVSVSASLATAKFNEIMHQKYPEKELAFFDARAWVLPQDEVCNYFLWREKDAIKNSISMVAQANFSSKALHKLNGDQKILKLQLEKNVDWNKLEVWKQRGACILKEQINYKKLINNEEINVIRNKWIVDKDIPIFSNDRDYINKYVYIQD